MLKNEDRYVRWRAAVVLGKLRDERPLEPLTQALMDEDREVREVAKEALEKIREKS